MLKRIFPSPAPAPGRAICVTIGEASFPAPFPHRLEYSPPCRGTWNIVHTGMLVPEAHQIFICAAGCLRGVALTAAEMGLMGRFSSIELRESDLTGRDNEQLILAGVADILAHLPEKPRAVLLFPACVHHFLGCNLRYVYRELHRRHPDIDFAECFMDPIRQTRHLTPEERLRRAISRLLPELPKKKQASFFGGNLKAPIAHDAARLLRENGWTVCDMADCASYNNFQELGASSLQLYTNPFSLPAVRDLRERLQQDCFYLPQVWDEDAIEQLLMQLAEHLGIKAPDCTESRQKAEQALSDAQDLIGQTPIAIDLTFTFRPLSLACLLLRHGFHVTKIYADAISPKEEADFRYLQEHHGDIELWPTKAPLLRKLPRPAHAEGAPACLALGQKAAFFQGTPHFVNLVEGGGRWGFSAIESLAHDIITAYRTPKDIEANVRRKGLGGPSLL